jgi:putative nucleotidyltransferase with HDIG domain
LNKAVPRRDEILRAIDSVESLPTASLILIRDLQNPEVSAADVARAVELDPSMTANLLRLANSAYFGAPRAVGSVREAVFRLGTKRIFNLVITTLAAPLLHRPVRGYDMPPDESLKHSVAVAVGTEALAAELGLTPPVRAFAAGLMHDIGKLLFGTFLEVEIEPVLALAASEKVSFDEAERQVLGIDHAELGALLLESWHLPGDIVQAVRFHHRPDAAPSHNPLITDLVHVADQLCTMGGLGNGVDGLNYRPSEATLARLGINNHRAERTLSAIMSGLSRLDEFVQACA